MWYKQEWPKHKYIANKPEEIIILSGNYSFFTVVSNKKKKQASKQESKLFLKFYVLKDRMWLEEGKCRPSF